MCVSSSVSTATPGARSSTTARFTPTRRHARLNLALRSFFHPAAGRELLWNLEHTPKLRPLLDSIDRPDRRLLVARVIDAFEERVAPRWPRLRAQVVHGDLTLGNVLFDDRDRISGIVDFGDLGYTA